MLYHSTWKRTSDGKNIDFSVQIDDEAVIRRLIKKALKRKSLKATAFDGAIKVKGLVV